MLTALLLLALGAGRASAQSGTQWNPPASSSEDAAAPGRVFFDRAEPKRRCLLDRAAAAIAPKAPAAGARAPRCLLDGGARTIRYRICPGSALTQPPADVRGRMASAWSEARRKASEFIGSDLPDVIAYVSRAAWGARTSLASEGRMTPRRMTLHHTEGPVTHSYQDSVRAIQAIQTFHRDIRKWGDIGYHFVLDGDGRIFQGRPEGQMGAHTYAHNEDNVGIAIQGNYDKAPPSPEQIQSFLRLATAVALDNHMDVESPTFLLGHRDWDSNRTNCPGAALHALLPNLRESLRQRVLALRAQGRESIAMVATAK